MVDAFTALAVLLLVLGVVGSLVPGMPGAGLSLLGIYIYWWSTGFSDPGVLAIGVFTVVGLLSITSDYLSAAVSAKLGGASTNTIIAAAAVGIVLFFVTGPLGLLLGVVGTVFVVELLRTRNARRGLRASIYTIVGILASAVVQLLLALVMLVAFVVLVAV